MSDCRFGVSPVHYPDPDPVGPTWEPDSCHEIEFLSAAKSSRIVKNTPGKTLEWFDSISKI